MAVKKIKFELPQGKVLNAELEETMVVSSFLNQLKIRELLSTNGNYEFRARNGSLIDPKSTFGVLSFPEITIVDLDQAEDPSDFSLGNIGDISTPRQFHQLGIFVLDGSGSMVAPARGGMTKAQAVNTAIRELLTRFKISKVKQNFSFAVVSFDTAAKMKLPVTESKNVDDNENYDPLVGHGGGTFIYMGLEEAYSIAEDFLSNTDTDGVPHSVIILLMTDGMCHAPNQTLETTKKIKESEHSGKITICASFFEQAGESKDRSSEQELLRNIVSDKVLGYKTVSDKETLRSFFEKSISAASGGVAP